MKEARPCKSFPRIHLFLATKIFSIFFFLASLANAFFSLHFPSNLLGTSEWAPLFVSRYRPDSGPGGGSGDLEPYGALWLDTGQASGRGGAHPPDPSGPPRDGNGGPGAAPGAPGSGGRRGGRGGPSLAPTPRPRGPRFPGARTRVGGTGPATWTGQLGPLAPIGLEPARSPRSAPGHAPP